MAKIIGISDGFKFDNGFTMESNHDTDCCEWHYLDFDSVSMSEVEGLDFDLSNDNFIEKVDGYGIRIRPINGHPISIPGYGMNNGCYSSKLDLIIRDDKGNKRVIDVSDCQVIED